VCLIAFALHASPRWPLVIAANRDEYRNRPTLPLAPWVADGGMQIVSGRDGRAGGTWMGITPAGRVAFLTNVRGPALARPALRSRGELVLRWLKSDTGVTAWSADVAAGDYDGCNLVVGDWRSGEWAWLSNRAPGGGASQPPSSPQGWASRRLSPGIYGLSNASLDTPWPKTQALTHALDNAMAAACAQGGEAAFRDAPLWSALASRQPAADGCLPRTGVPLEMERSLSSAFVDVPERAYGTRSSTVLVASALPSGELQLEVEEVSHSTTGPEPAPLPWRPGAREALRWPAHGPGGSA
jgi:uncharacterized protein with NRDE domain